MKQKDVDAVTMVLRSLLRNTSKLAQMIQESSALLAEVSGHPGRFVAVNKEQPLLHGKLYIIRRVMGKNKVPDAPVINRWDNRLGWCSWSGQQLNLSTASDASVQVWVLNDTAVKIKPKLRRYRAAR